MFKVICQLFYQMPPLTVLATDALLLLSCLPAAWADYKYREVKRYLWLFPVSVAIYLFCSRSSPKFNYYHLLLFIAVQLLLSCLKCKSFLLCGIADWRLLAILSLTYGLLATLLQVQSACLLIIATAIYHKIKKCVTNLKFKPLKKSNYLRLFFSNLRLPKRAAKSMPLGADTKKKPQANQAKQHTGYPLLTYLWLSMFGSKILLPLLFSLFTRHPASILP